MDAGANVAGNMTAVNGEEIGELAGESDGEARFGMQGIIVDGDGDVKMTDAKQVNGELEDTRTGHE